MVWVGGGIIIHGLEEYRSGVARARGARGGRSGGKRPSRRFRGRRVGRDRGGVGHRRPRGRGRAHPPRGARPGAGPEAFSRNRRRGRAASGLLTRAGRTVADPDAALRAHRTARTASGAEPRVPAHPIEQVRTQRVPFRQPGVLEEAVRPHAKPPHQSPGPLVRRHGEGDHLIKREGRAEGGVAGAVPRPPAPSPAPRRARTAASHSTVGVKLASKSTCCTPQKPIGPHAAARSSAAQKQKPCFASCARTRATSHHSPRASAARRSAA